MLTFACKTYAKNNSEFTDSLFTSGGTCNGFYKRVRNGIKLYTMQNKLEAFLVDNSHGERFVVTAHTTEQGDRYSFSTCSTTEKWLGIENMGSQAQYDAVTSAIKSINR